MNRMKIINFIISMALLSLMACSEGGGSSADDGDMISEVSTWQAGCVSMRNNYQACYGPGWSAGTPHDEKKFDFYEVSFEKVNSDSSSVLFGKRYAAEEVNPNLLAMYMLGVVKVDYDNDTLLFYIASEPLIINISEYIEEL